MQPEAKEVVDRGAYPDAVTPWEQADWREEALGWISHELAAHGLRASGPLRVRLRPWSVLVRLSVGDRTVWFKANPPASAFEAPLTEALSRWVPQHVLTPLSVSPDHGWSLLPDGGPLLRDVWDGDRAGSHAWEQALSQYAEMQRGLVAHTEEVEALGVPGHRTPDLPRVFDRLVSDSAVRDLTDKRETAALRLRVVEWSAELSAAGIPDALDHADLHDGQLFAPAPGRFTFFDWGDAAITHPFCSLLVPARAAHDRFGPGILPRLRDAYLEPWTGSGLTTGELHRALRLAWRLAAIGRASSWGRLFRGDTAGANPARGAEVLWWLRHMLTEPPL
ncbi:aminoglycoside phosphotransferase family protein [Streptomyces sp. NPDC007088]|uniref:aminoglycoside phosphotransferase family protein n=1 Tax=Streptomyces sp. NPDC007088 TaxID=3364773 RepID=UPI00367E83BF